MRLVCDPLFSEVDLMASAEELSRLARAVADGEGLLGSTASPGSNVCSRTICSAWLPTGDG